MVFCFVWTTLVYNVVAYWTWGARGWSKNIACLDTIGSLDTAPCGIGSYDYAGGGPVHVASGFAGLAYCLIVGPRARKGSEEFKAHNLMNVFLGTALLWFGWLGFNGGSAIASTPRAALAAFVTMVSASCGALTWASIVQVTTKKWSAEAFCAGAVAGLVGITPASGFVAPWAAIVIGVTSGALGCYSVRLKHMFGFDDTLDAFGLHGVIGAWGNIMTGIFATKWVAALDGAAINGGFIDGNFIQMGYQLADTVAVAAYSFTVSYAILFIMNKVPGLSLRSKDEVIGCDLGEMGEVAYEAVSVTTSSDPLMDMKKGPKESSEVTMEVA